MIRLAGIERTFIVGEEAVHALRGVNLEIAQGEYLSIMGPSGSGKSTLLNVIGLLDRPSAGTYELDRRNVTGLDDDEWRRPGRRPGYAARSPALKLTNRAAMLEWP